MRYKRNGWILPLFEHKILYKEGRTSAVHLLLADVLLWEYYPLQFRERTHPNIIRDSSDFKLIIASTISIQINNAHIKSYNNPYIWPFEIVVFIIKDDPWWKFYIYTERERREVIHTGWRPLIGINVDENDIAIQIRVFDCPFDGILTVLIFVNSYRRGMNVFLGNRYICHCYN